MLSDFVLRATLAYLRCLYVVVRFFRGNAIVVVNNRLLRARRVERILSAFGATVEGPCEVHGPLVIHNANADYSRLTIGRNVHIGPLVIFDLTSDVVVKEDATVSMGVVVLTHQDVGDRPLQKQYPRKVHRTVIGEGCYIGASATILAGCDIGARAIVAAGAVVTRPVPDGTLVAGVPATPQRCR